MLEKKFADIDAQTLWNALKVQLDARENAITQLETVAGLSPGFLRDQVKDLKRAYESATGSDSIARLKAYSDALEKVAIEKIGTIRDGYPSKTKALDLFGPNSAVGHERGVVATVEAQQEQSRQKKDLLVTAAQTQEAEKSIDALIARKTDIGSKYYGEPGTPGRKAMDKVVEIATDDTFKALTAARDVLNERDNDEHSSQDILKARKAYIAAAGQYIETVAPVLDRLERTAPALQPNPQRRVEAQPTSGLPTLASIPKETMALA